MLQIIKDQKSFQDFGKELLDKGVEFLKTSVDKGEKPGAAMGSICAQYSKCLQFLMNASAEIAQDPVFEAEFLEMTAKIYLEKAKKIRAKFN